MNPRTIVLFVVFAAVLLVSSASLFSSFGLYIDDWLSGTYLYAQSLPETVMAWNRDFRIEINNFRPLEIILPVLYYAGFAAFGLPGVNAITFLFYLILCWLIFLFLRVYVREGVAFLSAILFALLPYHNLSLWQNGAHYVLGLTFMLGAVLAFQREKKLLASLLIICAFFMNESSLLVFGLAILPASPSVNWSIIRARLRSVLWFYAPLLAGYVILRFSAERFGLIGGHSIGSGLESFSVLTYGGQFLKALLIGVIGWAEAGWKLMIFGNMQTVVLGLVAAVLFALAHKKLSNDNAVSIRHLLWVGLAGVLVIFAGRYYSFFNPVGLNVYTFNSRFFFVSSLGFTILIACLFEYGLAQHRRAWQTLTLGIFATLFTIGAMAKFEVQKDFVRAWQEGRAIWQALYYQIPALPENGLLILSMVDDHRGVVVNRYDGFGTFADSIHRFYGPRVSAEYASNMLDVQVTTKQVCFRRGSAGARIECRDRAKIVWSTWDGEELHVHLQPPRSKTDQPIRLPINIRRALSISS